MTTCIPIRPFRCWQYRKGEPVPEWAESYLDERDDEEWLVDYHFGCWWYTPAEFAERFKIVEGIADIKIEVLKVSLGIKSLEDKELFERLEQFWIDAYAKGRRDESGE
jgi:hypothetical protein